jgi:hypothetical protein
MKVEVGRFKVESELLEIYSDHVNAELLSDPTILPRFRGYTDAYNYDKRRRELHDRIIKDAGIKDSDFEEFELALTEWIERRGLIPANFSVKQNTTEEIDTP